MARQVFEIKRFKGWERKKKKEEKSPTPLPIGEAIGRIVHIFMTLLLLRQMKTLDAPPKSIITVVATREQP